MRDKIFISYAHEDEERLDALKKFLEVPDEALVLWDDSRIKPGDKWKREIESALATARIAVLLVTQSFFASRFIREEELPVLLRAAEAGEVSLLWIAWSPSRYKGKELESYQSLNDPKLPLSRMEKPQREQALVEIAEEIRRQAGAVRQARGPHPAVAPPPPCPYPGLQSFGEKDAAYFFGREEEIETLLRDLGRLRFLLVLGPSGSGKSSLLHGGLLPRLSSGSWAIEKIRPHQYLADYLEDRFPGLSKDPGKAVGAYLSGQPAAANVLLVVDQFEECFSRMDKAQQERLFAILKLLREQPRCTVVLALRAAFFEDLMGSGLWPVEKDQRLEIAPLRGERLREAIERPAEAVNVRIEESLVVLLLEDAGDEPGRLPLLQTTLERLWSEVRNGLLAREAYERLNPDGHRRIAVALVEKADRAFFDLSPAQREIARRVFVRLVQPIEGRPDTRRRQPLSALIDEGDDRALVERTVHLLADQRLLTVGSGEEKPVDLAHEALLTAWPRLQDWLLESRESERFRRRLEAKAEEWDRLGRRGGLLDEIELREVEEWVRAHGPLSRKLAELTEASRAALAELEAVRQSVRAAALAAHSEAQRDRDPELSLLLAAEAVSATWERGRPPVLQAEAALRRALFEVPVLRILSGHEAGVKTIAFDKDGRRVVTASQDGTARIWEAETGKPLRSLTGHAGSVNDAAFGPDGSSVLTAGDDGTARVWNAQDGRETLRFEKHRGPVRCAAFNPFVDQAASGEHDGTILIWDTKTGKVHRKLAAHSGPVQALSYSLSFARLASAGEDATVKVWSPQDGKQTTVLQGHVNPVWDVEWSRPSGAHLISAGEDRTAKVWMPGTAETWKEIQTLRGHTAGVTAAGLGPEGQQAATAGKDGTVRIWDVASGRELHRLQGHTAAVTGITFSPDGRRLATAGEDQTGRIWDLTANQGQVVVEVPGAHQLGGVAVSPDGRSAVVAAIGFTCVYRVSQAQIWDLATGKAGRILGGHSGGVTDAAFSPDGRSVVTASEDGTVRIWDVSTGTERSKLPHDAYVSSARYSPDGTLLVTATRNGSAQIWKVAAAQKGPALNGHTGAVTRAVFSPEPRRLRICTGGADHTARIWDENGQVLLTLVGHTGEVTDVAWSPDGRRVATSSADRTARIWDAQSGAPLRVLTGHMGQVRGISWSRDGRSLATAGADQSARLWDAGTGEQRAVLTGHRGALVGVAFSPDGQRLLTAANDKTVRQYVVGIDELLALAARRATRQLTPEERSIYLGEVPSRSATARSRAKSGNGRRTSPPST
jgi:WD40 repeat protein